MNTIRYSALVAVAIAMTANSADAQVKISQDGRPERIFRPVSGVTQHDINFMHDAAIANIFEIQASEIAQSKTTNPFVSEFAKEMIADHRMALDELTTTATEKGIHLPQDVTPDLKHELMHLENLNGVAFDNAFEKAQMRGHEAASTLFKSEIRYGKDEDVRNYAVLTLPVITMHYKMVLNKDTMMGPTAMKGGS